MTNIEPKFEPLALSRNDWPRRWRCRDAVDARRSARPRSPRISPDMRSLRHALGSLQRGRVGQLHVDQQIALVLLGMKPVGVA